MGIWTIVSVVCVIVAGLLLQRRNFDGAFVAAALGAVAWFLNYRAGLRRTIIEETETTIDEEEPSDEDEDDEEK